MTLNEFLTGIANAIRAKKGTTGTIKATDFASEIASISGGGASQQLALRADGRITDVTAEELEGAQYIGAYMFYGCDKLIRVGLPDSTTSIKTNAFAGIGAYDIVLPNTMTSLGERAFWYCPNLLMVTMSSTMTTISTKAFQTCANLQIVDFSNYTRSSVPTLSNADAFTGCHANLIIIVPQNLLSSWQSATNWSSLASKIRTTSQDLDIVNGFYDGYEVVGLGDCTDTHLVIPSTYNGNPVTSIGDDAFYDEGFTRIIISNSVKYIGCWAFDSCSYVSRIILGNSVETIDEGAFYNNGITSIFIPRSVTYIGYSAFEECYDLYRVDLSTHTKVPTLGSGAFDYCSDDLQIKVPSSLLNAFKTATNWSDYADCIVTAFTN